MQKTNQFVLGWFAMTVVIALLWVFDAYTRAPADYSVAVVTTGWILAWAFGMLLPILGTDTSSPDPLGRIFTGGACVKLSTPCQMAAWCASVAGLIMASALLRWFHPHLLAYAFILLFATFNYRDGLMSLLPGRKC